MITVIRPSTVNITVLLKLAHAFGTRVKTQHNLLNGISDDVTLLVTLTAHSQNHYAPLQTP